MPDKTSGTQNMHALLIGIDRYLPNELPGGLYYGDLTACVNDINEVEKFLREEIGLQASQITKLTAGVGKQSNDIEPPEVAPTYTNMVNAFKNLIKNSNRGDQVYIHYSGHGGRATPKFRSFKGENGFDEVLVPSDIGDSQGRYFRDIEFAYLIRKMLDKDLIVSIVLDSCHSGSATRDPKMVARYARPRGIGRPDTKARPMDSFVASDEELLENWQALASQNQRNLFSGSNWLLEPRGYVLLAACRASEFAYEFAVNEDKTQGALTYFWLQSLRQLGSGATYKMAHDWLFGKVRSYFGEQTPQLEGEGNRVVFGSEQIRPYYAVNVLKVDEPGNRVLLQAGEAQGLLEGADFFIYPPGTTDMKEVANCQALAQISELGASESWSKIIKKFKDSPITGGAQAVLSDQGYLKLYGKVCLLQTPDLPQSIDQHAALSAVEKAIEHESSRFLELVTEDMPVDLFVSVNAQGEYQVLDPSKYQKQLRPALKLDDERAPAMIAQRLVHLTKYRNVRLIDNNNRLSNLARKVRIELAGYMPNYKMIDKPEPIPFDQSTKPPEVKVGEWVFLRIKNEFSHTLNLTILDLQPDYGISQVYPESPASFESLDPGQDILLPLCTSLPDGYSEGEDLLKFFLTIGPTDFRWLQIPPLDKPLPSRALTRTSNDPLQAVINSLIPLELRKRNLKTAVDPGMQWWTGSVALKIVSGGRLCT
jgi:hypothetical protein